MNDVSYKQTVATLTVAGYTTVELSGPLRVLEPIVAKYDSVDDVIKLTIPWVQGSGVDTVRREFAIREAGERETNIAVDDIQVVYTLPKYFIVSPTPNFYTAK